MMRAAKYYARNPSAAVRALRDPIAIYWSLRNKLDDAVAQLSGSYRQAPTYPVSVNWEARLHEQLERTGACTEQREFASLWDEVTSRLVALGNTVGPQSFFGWNDGDMALTQTIWYLVRHLRPARVVETGVGHGITTRFILEAIERNGRGHLWSIDPPPADPNVAAQIGIAVEGPCAKRWTLLRGTSRQHLPKLLAQLGEIELFIHDSLHTTANVHFEIREARRAMRERGFIVVDDIDVNAAFGEIIATLPARRWLACEARPLRPDSRRFNQKGLFGIILPDIPAAPLH
jgi:hypothetical protein